ncbi:type VI secretion system amidase effector protein Tae4 [Agrobacterium vitis]|uniref:Cytoplasmic protein n=1 Tax=Agrobacterium vitis TaxID=373 RepID=A0A7K1RCE3_AGRVI|nr:type VI secretion system amidase effector protein Tae4 [Agrobacterium vitis]MVA55372.1 cytoplasmic protein [Agrobacterium vitis]
MGRPNFNIAWAASMRIYDPQASGAKVSEVIGGNVAKNVNNPNPVARWSNTCAVRMSYILNYSGMHLPHVAAQTVSGADQKWYFFRVKNLIDYLEKTWGKPEVVQYPTSNGGTLAGKRGVILFEVSGWSDAQGHATLFNGTVCYDHCYFNEPGVAYKTDKANFWSLQ